MTDIEQKALALVNEVLEGKAFYDTPFTRLPAAVSNLVLLRAIEQHEAFRQEVSDAVEVLITNYSRREAYCFLREHLSRFIIPAPKPDPLADAVESVLSGFEGRKHAESYANQIRAALEARGLEIREKAT